MDKTKASEFLNGLYQKIWQEGEIDAISNYYHHELQMLINGKKLNYDDIKLKIIEQHKNGLQMQYSIIDIAAEDNFIAFHVEVTSLYVKDNALEVGAFFHLREGKIWRAWGLSRSLL